MYSHFPTYCFHHFLSLSLSLSSIHCLLFTFLLEFTPAPSLFLCLSFSDSHFLHTSISLRFGLFSQLCIPLSSHLYSSSYLPSSHSSSSSLSSLLFSLLFFFGLEEMDWACCPGAAALVFSGPDASWRCALHAPEHNQRGPL